MFTRTRILIIIAAALLLGGGIYAFFRLQRAESPVRDPLEAIPNTAFCLLHSDNIRDSWKALSQGNLVWDAMGETEWAAAASHIAQQVDSMLNADAAINDLIDDQPCWLSLHGTGDDGMNFVFATALPSQEHDEEVIAFLKKNLAGKTISESEWKTFHLLKVGEERSGGFTIAAQEGLVVISDNAELLKTGLAQLEKGPTLKQDAGFQRVQETAGEKTKANVYLNYERLTVALKRLSGEALRERLDLLPAFAGWTEMDVSFRPNALLLNGYTFAGDSAHQYLTTLSGQQPQLVEADEVLPANTISYVDYGISNADLYFEKYAAYLERLGKSDERNGGLLELSASNHFAMSNSFNKWLGNELVQAEIPGPNGITPIALLSTNNTALARSFMTALEISDSLPAASTDSSGYTVRHVAAHNLLPVVFGDLFNGLEDAYYTVIRQYIVFAPDENTLRTIIQANESNQVLLHERAYADFVTNMSDEASLTIWISPARSERLLRENASENFLGSLQQHLSLLRRFDGASLQYSTNDNGLYYTNIFLRHNPQGKKDLSTLWETQLDSSFSGKPWLVNDHKTKGLDVFLQDDGNTVYLVSSTGSILWKRKLDGKIIGDVQQVDALKNGKLQLAFNTASAIYIIDRNGNDLAPFPLKLPANATNPVRVLDYENNREYRFLVACSDKKIYNYTIKGQKVDGWKLPATDDIVLAPLQHTVVSGKDYVIAVDRSGKTCITDRQGAVRLKLKERLNGPVKKVFLETGKDLSRTRLVAMDSLGNVSRLSLNDELERLHFLDFRETPGFDYRDIDGDGSLEFMFMDSHQLMAFHQDKSPAMSFTFSAAVLPQPIPFAFDASDIRIGAVAAESGELHLINKGGADAEGFPLPGSTIFGIGRLNGENGFTLVCGNNKRYLCAYALP